LLKESLSIREGYLTFQRNGRDRSDKELRAERLQIAKKVVQKPAFGGGKTQEKRQDGEKTKEILTTGRILRRKREGGRVKDDTRSVRCTVICSRGIEN